MTTELQVNAFGAVESDGKNTLTFSAKWAGPLEIHATGNPTSWVYIPVAIPSIVDGRRRRITHVWLWHEYIPGRDIPGPRVEELEVRQVRRHDATRLLFNGQVFTGTPGWHDASAVDERSDVLDGSPWVRMQVNMGGGTVLRIGQITLILEDA